MNLSLAAALTMPFAFILLLVNVLLGYAHYHRGKRWCVWVAAVGSVCAVVVLIFCFKQLWS